MILKKRSAESSASQIRKLTPPGVFVLRMLIFLILVGFLGAILYEQLRTAFMTNPGLNGLIPVSYTHLTLPTTILV